MYLKAIEIVGFKSFADRVRFELQPGMTCIVGPNGCGKSNVVDAIRWSIGEMSWKSLRSTSMVGIIFDGTAKRSQLNMAEVTLVFDNSTKRLPIDFTEVTVTRRILRSGESEYYLNKVQCRLRDIRDLFLDTGIGGEGYAIIDQGGVEFVLSAKPEERRDIFEEAAGVSKYKAKRDEALKKLERVEQDIARLMDSVTLIEEQIKKLDAEARKAKTYQKYREELRAGEIALLLETAMTHDAEAKKSEEEYLPLKELLETRLSSITALEGDLASLNIQLTEKQAELSRYGEKISAVKYQLGVLEGNIRNCDNIAAELDKQIQDSEQEDALAKRRISELEPVMASMKAQLEGITAQLQPLQAQSEEKKAELRRQEEELQVVSSAQDQANSRLMKATQSEMECANKIALEQSGLRHFEEDLINNEKERQQKAAQLESAAAEMAGLKTSLDASRAAAESMRVQISDLESRVAGLTSGRAELSEKLASSRSEKAVLEATRDMLRSQGSKDPYWVGAQAVLSASVPGVRGTLRQHVTVSPDVRLCVEEAMGHYLNSVLCDSFDTARKAADLLRQTGNARCRFIVMGAVPQAAQLDPAAAELKARLQYPGEYENIVAHALSGCALEGGDVRGGFWLVGGADKVEATDVYWAKEEEVGVKLLAVVDQEKNYAAGLVECEASLADLSSRLTAQREDLNRELLNGNTLENSISSIEQNCASLRETLSLIEQEKAGLTAEKDKKQAAIQGLQSSLGSIKAEQEAVSREIEELAVRKNGVQASMSALRAAVETLASSISEIRLKFVSLEADTRRVQAEQQSMQEACSRRDAQRSQARGRIAALGEEKLGHETQLSTQRDALAELEVNESMQRAEMASVKSVFDEKSGQLNSIRSELNQMQIKVHDLENRINSHHAMKNEAVQKLQEEWQMTPETAATQFGGTPVDHERVKNLRRKIENMGAVNMTAPEEYDALASRDQFLKTQIEDLNQAKNDLRSAISRINATTRENFRHTFDQVREHFKQIYQKLFVGGEADLVLTQPDNLLETGVEILAQPPGKKLQSISSMSGGEKAFTALALLFSFFCVNPSPFCVMDEADAPLDDANVERYLNMLHDFAGKTQFIVITHNKRTMEAADSLYGVTMEESGVSKVMSVSLSKNGGADVKDFIKEKAAATAAA